MKALIITADLFEDSELKIPYRYLKEQLGMDVDIASFKKGVITGKHGLPAEVTLSFDEVDPSSYEILILPGGKAPTSIRKDNSALKIVQSFFKDNKLIAAICHGPQILISAGLLKGSVVTGYKSIAKEIKDSGACYKDEEVVIDHNLITSRKPSDLDAFMKAIKAYIDQH